MAILLIFVEKKKKKKTAEKKVECRKYTHTVRLKYKGLYLGLSFPLSSKFYEKKKSAEMSTKKVKEMGRQ